MTRPPSAKLRLEAGDPASDAGAARTRNILPPTSILQSLKCLDPEPPINAAPFNNQKNGLDSILDEAGLVAILEDLGLA
jgi:hypothetical protein